MRSVGMSQEICFHEKSYKFAVKVDIRIAQDATQVSFLFQSNSICINTTNVFLFYVDE